MVDEHQKVLDAAGGLLVDLDHRMAEGLDRQDLAYPSGLSEDPDIRVLQILAVFLCSIKMRQTAMRLKHVATRLNTRLN